MHKTFFFLALAAVALAYRGWEPISVDDIPKAKPSDNILIIQLEVRLLFLCDNNQAPLFFAQYGHLLEHFNLFHSGVGFVNLNSGFVDSRS